MLRRLRETAHGKVQNALREVLDERGGAELDGLRGDVRAALQETRDQLLEEITRLRTELDDGLQRSTERLRQEVVDLEWRRRRDLYFAADVRAAADTHEFMQERMPFVLPFPHPHETLRHAASQVAVDGMALEFGVATGGTLRILSDHLPGRRVAGFDTFDGLPEDWRTGFPAGEFRQDALPEVHGAELVVGLFEDTLPGFLADHPGPVALLHVDSDLYSSAATVFEHVGRRLVAGSIVVFDEYFNYPGWRLGEHRAWTEFVERTGTQFEYLAYTFNHEQLVVRLTQAPQH